MKDEFEAEQLFFDELLFWRRYENYFFASHPIFYFGAAPSHRIGPACFFQCFICSDDENEVWWVIVTKARLWLDDKFFRLEVERARARAWWPGPKIRLRWARTNGYQKLEDKYKPGMESPGQLVNIFGRFEVAWFLILSNRRFSNLYFRQ